MASSKRPETMAKRAREHAVKEQRERKRQKKSDAAAARAANPEPDDTQVDPE